jgi:hypothetical protein
MFEICAPTVKSAGVPVKNPPNPAIPLGDLGTIDESGMKIHRHPAGVLRPVPLEYRVQAVTCGFMRKCA